MEERQEVKASPRDRPRWVAVGALVFGAGLVIGIAVASLTAAGAQTGSSSPSPSAGGIPFRHALAEHVFEERPRLGYPPKPSRRSCRMTGASSLAEIPHIRWQISARNHPAPCHSN